MKELCIDARMGLHTGIGAYIRNLVSYLKEGPFKVRLLVNPDMIMHWPALQQFDLILTSAPIYSAEEQFKLSYLIPRSDIFWSPHYNIPLGPIRSKKRVVTIHDVCHLAYQKTLSIPQRFYANVVIRAAAKLSHHIFTVSSFSMGEIVKYTKVSVDKISIIYPGVDTAQFSSPFNEAQIRQKYRLPSKYFLFVSRLAPHKNVNRLLLAWKLILEQHKDEKLVLVGKKMKHNSWEEILRRYPSLQDSILFTQEVADQDLSAIYQMAYATVHPALYEGFGLIPLEAMSASCPTVVSKIASLPEVCGDCTIYVDPYNVEDIAQGILKIINHSDLYTELQRKGLERSRIFTWGKTAQEHLKVLEKL